MLRPWLCGILTLGALAADEPRDTAAWVEALSEAYSKATGYTATYRSVGENKVLDANIAVDQQSGRFAFELSAAGPGGKFRIRQWNTSDGVIFADDNGKRMKISGAKDELDYLRSFGEILPAGEPLHVDALQYSPFLLLTSDRFKTGMYFGTRRSTQWEQLTEGDLELMEATADRVVFGTKGFGKLTIDRTNGILIRQETFGEKGEERNLDRVKFKQIRDDGTVDAMCRDWSTLGAVEAGLPWGAMTSRLDFFQQVIGWIDSGKGDLEKLEEKFSRTEELRNFATQILLKSQRPVQSPVSWEKVLDLARTEARKRWTTGLPEGAPGNEEAFADYLAVPGNRVAVRDSLAKSMVATDGLIPMIMPEIWGPGGGDGLKADSPSSRAAKKCIETALCQAFITARLEEMMAKSWGERKDLD